MHGPVQVAVREIPGQGRGLVATQRIRKGEPLLQVPAEKLVITTDTVLKGVDTMAGGRWLNAGKGSNNQGQHLSWDVCFVRFVACRLGGRGGTFPSSAKPPQQEPLEQRRNHTCLQRFPAPSGHPTSCSYLRP